MKIVYKIAKNPNDYKNVGKKDFLENNSFNHLKALLTLRLISMTINEISIRELFCHFYFYTNEFPECRQVF